jgi:hypothetical protein
MWRHLRDIEQLSEITVISPMQRRLPPCGDYQRFAERYTIHYRLPLRPSSRPEGPFDGDREWPEPDDGDEGPDPLFDSTRDYVEQIDCCKDFQKKPIARRNRARHDDDRFKVVGRLV